jgi:N-acetylglucosaminyldiphosphoundecaprenol N-acetyl-beta-D-mannosaminyltransferase
MPKFSVKERVVIGGVSADNVTMPEAVDRIGNLIEKKVPSYVVTPNVDHVVRFQDDGEFREVYAQAALVLPDGMPLVWAGRFFGTPLKGRVSGADLVPALCPLAVEKGYTLFLLGGRPGAVEKASQNLQERFPGLRIAGTYSPPYGFERDPEENARIVEKIRRASPDILLVGLGSPKQEKWAYRHYREMRVPVTVGVGVTFEFIAGMVKRAPLFMQRSGFEWLWRFIQEPARLWKRYLLDDPRFFWLILRQRLSR